VAIPCKQKLIALQNSEALTQEAEITRLRNQGASFELDIATTKKEAAAANERAGKLEKDAAELTTKNLQLEAAIAPRRLGEGEAKELAALGAFANSTVMIESYANDAESLVLANQIVDSLTKSKIRIEDNRLTMQPAGSILLGISIQGSDKALVDELKKILGDLANSSTIRAGGRDGVSFAVAFGRTSSGITPAATIAVGIKPIR
jgi:hypothetical protein